MLESTKLRQVFPSDVMSVAIKGRVKSAMECSTGKIYTLSSLINNHQAFEELAQAAYNATDFICVDYPSHFRWYWAKQLPRVFNGTGDVVVYTIDDNVAGVALLKKECSEKKICTLLVVEGYRGKHIGTKLLEYAFQYLGTTQPLITIADYKLPMFAAVIKKYGWKLTQTMEKGYYNNSYSELVFNGELRG